MASPGHFQLLHFHPSVTTRKIKLERFVLIAVCQIYTAPTPAAIFFRSRLGRSLSSAGFSLWGLVLARANPHRLKPALLKAAKMVERRSLFPLAMRVRASQNIVLHQPRQ
jgi:hypothetical protein